MGDEQGGLKNLRRAFRKKWEKTGLSFTSKKFIF